MTSPLVSVLIACHNHEAFIEQALDSIAAQDFTDFELIITDDASTDATVSVIQQWLQRTGFPAELIAHQTNVGTCGTRNEALQKARGTFVCFLDADDWSEPHRLRLHTEAFDSFPDDVAMIVGEIREVTESGEPLRRPTIRKGPVSASTFLDDAFRELLDSNFVPFTGVMLRRRCVNDVGGFDEDLFLDDHDLWLRLSHKFRLARVGGVVASYRVLTNSVSHSPKLFKKIWISNVGSLRKWVGYSPLTDEIIARRLRILALNIRTEGERSFVNDVFSLAHKIRPSPFWSLVRQFSRLSIAGAVFRFARSLKRRGMMTGLVVSA